MFNTCSVNTKTYKSSTDADPRHVCCFVPDWIFLGKKAVYNLQFSISNSGSFNMLQWLWQLLVLGKL